MILLKAQVCGNSMFIYIYKQIIYAVKLGKYLKKKEEKKWMGWGLGFGFGLGAFFSTFYN